MRLPLFLLTLAFSGLSIRESVALNVKRNSLKQQVTLEDPSLKKGSAAKTDRSSEVSQQELPNSLLRHSSQALIAKGPAIDAMSPINYVPLREMVAIHDWEGLETATKFLLMMRGDVHEADRLRLELIHSLAISHLGRTAEALARLAYYKKYLDFSLKDLRQLRDITRLKELRAHLLLVEFDIQQSRASHQ